jgi:hypothetical protein
MEEPMDITKDQFDHLNHGHYLRGLVINEFCGLESGLQRYIATYFLGDSDSRKEFSNIILDRLTFEAKRTSLKTILDKKAIEKGFVKTKNNKWPHAQFLDEIRRLNDHRNYFAHYLMTMPQTPTDKAIGLAEFRDNLKIITYTDDEIQKLLTDITTTYHAIEELIEAL